MHIGIAGNIGAGKTTLTTLLAHHYGWTPKFESVTYNPYLEDYYKDIKRWSFALEMYFLQQRLHDIMEIRRSKDVIIQDRTLFGACIFLWPTTTPREICRRGITILIWTHIM